MEKKIIVLTIILILGSLITAGCTKYSEPVLKITTNATKISENAATGSIEYDVRVTIANTGDNNAYKVKILTVLSTPKDLSEYRFTNKNTEIGDILKGTTTTITERMVLNTTKSNYDVPRIRITESRY